MEEAVFFRIFNLWVGIIGLAIAICVILVPKTIRNLENKLDKSFSTEILQKILDQRRNLTDILLKHPKIFGMILFVISFLLILSSIYLF